MRGRKKTGRMDEDLEELAAVVRARAGLEQEELELAPEIAQRLLGPDAIALVPTLRGCGYLQQTERGYRILLRPHDDMNFTIAHEVGHWALRAIAGFRGSAADEERAANYVGAAILAPAGAVARAHAYWGERLRTMARAFGLSQTSMVLRLAEVRGDERAIVTRSGNVLLRSRGAFPWSSVPVVDVARGETRWRGLAKARLTGGIDHGRVALRAR